MLQFVKYYEADQAIRTRLRKIPLVNFDTQLRKSKVSDLFYWLSC